MRGLRARALIALCMTMALVVADAPAAAADPVGFGLKMEVLSSPRPSVITGGDALVRLTYVRPLQPENVRIIASSPDVKADLVAQPDGSLIGLVTGLPLGKSILAAHLRVGVGIAILAVENHPADGPVFSGPQQLPFFCQTQAFGLAPAVQPSCEAPTVVSYVYRTTTNQFAPLADPNTVPANAAQATVDGRSVPYIVRVERGTIDRAVFEFASLYDGQSPSPTRAHGAWNRRLVYTFGGGCHVGYRQGANTGGVLTDLFLSRGYAVASSSLNVLDNNCSPVISAEAAMMVREHFIEEFGPVAHTIGWGSSGGAIQQYQIADNYPGILDGIIPQLSFPDPVTTGPTVGDCRLFDRYFANPTSVAFAPAERNAASGYGSFGSCVSWDRSFASRGNPTEACPAAIPVEFRYNPDTNPDGIKCTSAEQWAPQTGRDPANGFARSVTDNVGVQYGLTAVNAGQISPEQFVDLNEKIGGYDLQGNSVPNRTEADPVGLTRIYRSGLVTNGGNGLRTTPIIDLRAYTDAINDIHTRFWSFTTRQRLIDENGDADNQVMLTYGLPTPAANPALVALQGMDAWLTAIEADSHHGNDRAKILRNKPADLVDGCWNAAGVRINEAAVYQGTGACNTAYPAFADTRIAAGAPLRDNILKCQLKKLDFADYAVTFTAEQQARLQATFATGVCDYTKKGVNQHSPNGTWQDFSNPPS